MTSWRKHTSETIKSLTDKQLEAGRKTAALNADYGRNFYERSDGWRVLEMIEREQGRRAGTILEPADPGDVRFELVDPSYDEETGEPMFNEELPYGLLVVDDQGEIVQRHAFATSWERSSMVLAHREHQSLVEEADRLGVHPLEIAFAPFGPECEREQEERRYGW